MRKRTIYRRVPCPICGGRMELTADLENKPLWVCTGFLNTTGAHAGSASCELTRPTAVQEPCLATAAYHEHFNQNPRLGVLLRHRGASVRLVNCLCRWRMRGLVWFLKEWPMHRLRRECPGFGKTLQDELVRIVNS